MANGIIIIDKPADWTSQDVTAKLRGVFATRRVGHGGTLDPMATGVLPVFVGRATRAVEFFTEARKEYIATLRLGLVTDTQDMTGRILEESGENPGKEAVESALPRFCGKQQQIPPMYSAIKVGGKKLYELARSGKEVERAARDIEIFSLELLEAQGSDYTIRVACSKGTYIRTLCHDIGAFLGCGGTMAALRRTQAGAYTLDQAVPLSRLLEEKKQGMDVERYLLPVDSLFLEYPALTLTPAQEKCARNGAAFSLPGQEQTLRLYGGDGTFLALARREQGVVKTIKNFFEV